MATQTRNGVTWSYTYDANGMRTKRSSDSKTYEYVYMGDKLVQMTITDHTTSPETVQLMEFSYDAAGQPLTLTLDGVTYYYVLNIQGDVMGMVDGDGNLLYTMVYEGYGAGYYFSGGSAAATMLLGTNPLGYRGYVMDSGTGLYYLQSRYYDPALGRFINADALVSTGQGLLCNNMLAYCKNNPIIYADNAGFLPCHVMMCHADGVNSVVDEGVRWQMRDKQKSAKDWLLENVGIYGNVNAEQSEIYYFIWCTYENGIGYTKALGKEKTINFYGTATWLDLSGGVKINGDNFGMSFEVGSDASVGLHFANVNWDFGTNGRGRGYIQHTVSDGNLYTYQKLSFNIPEIVGTVLVLIYVPELLPYIIEAFSTLRFAQV